MKWTVEKSRYSVTFTKPFKVGLTEMIERGIYLDFQDAIRGSIREAFEKYGIDPFSQIVLSKEDEEDG